MKLLLSSSTTSPTMTTTSLSVGWLLIFVLLSLPSLIQCHWGFLNEPAKHSSGNGLSVRIVPSGRTDESWKPDNRTCNPVPIRNETFMVGEKTFVTDIEVFNETKYFVVFLAEKNNQTDRIDPFALQRTFQPAYNTSIDNCTKPNPIYDIGANRSVTNCTVVLSQIAFERDALLIECLEYTSTSIDGNVTIYYNETQNYFNKTKEAATGTCECTCDYGPVVLHQEGDNNDNEDYHYDVAVLPTFLQFVSPNNTCNCPGCDDEDDIPNCVCYAPYIDTLVSNWNTLYKNESDALGINVTITNVTEVMVLPKDCSLETNDGRNNITYYNSTSVCLPGIYPTRSPTHKPTRKPTHKPTRKPTHKPTKHPTRHPTEHPTRHPTHKPTRHPVHPTRKPTRHPVHPTRKPTRHPTRKPSPHPTHHPTPHPITPTSSPTRSPTNSPTRSPTNSPTRPSTPTIEDVICNEGADFLFLCATLRSENLLNSLEEQVNITLFAPTDEAFLSYLGFSCMEDVVDSGAFMVDDSGLLTASDPANDAIASAAADAISNTDIYDGDGEFTLKDILLVHVTREGVFDINDLICGEQITTFLTGQNTTTICTTSFMGKAQVGAGQTTDRTPEIIRPSIDVSNGIIQVINNVIIPAEPAEVTGTRPKSPTESPEVVTSGSPTVQPTPRPTPIPTDAAQTIAPVPAPTESPTEGTSAPTTRPTPRPTPAPVPAPTTRPTPTPTPAPVPAPTESPTPAPVPAPTESPTPAPVPAPTEPPTPTPTPAPVPASTESPIEETDASTNIPTDPPDE